MFLSDNKAQVSFEYLLTIVFAILLVVAALIFALNLKTLVDAANTRILEYSDKFFKNIFG